MEQKIKEYTVLIAFSPSELIKLVNENIEQGWQPIGGIHIALAPPDNGMQQSISLQSMIR